MCVDKSGGQSVTLSVIYIEKILNIVDESL